MKPYNSPYLDTTRTLKELERLLVEYRKLKAKQTKAGPAYSYIAHLSTEK